MISPEISVDIRFPETVDTGDDKGRNEDDVSIDPYVVGYVVVLLPLDGCYYVVD